MKKTLLQDTLKNIKPLDFSLAALIKQRLDSLTKPQGSLGRLEELALRYSLIRGQIKPQLIKKLHFVFAADHGITEEGVSAYPKEVTAQMVYNFLRGGAAINVLARHAGIDVRVVDIGVDYDFGEIQGLIVRKVKNGTRNFLKGRAMEIDEAIMALEIGIELVENEISLGADIIGVGDMGIGNTTPSSAIISVITGKPVSSVTGRGTGIDDTTLQKKQKIIEQAIEIHKPRKDDPIDVLSKIGGLEIAGIAGAILGCAARRIPVVLDGVITAAGALIAYQLKKDVIDYIFASHLSVEPGHKAALEYLNLSPIFDLNLRLGEGTGACLGINLIEAGVKIMNEMETFKDAGVSERKK